MADPSSDLRRRTVLMLEEMGIPVEHAQHEDAPSQHEIDLRYTDALTMADTVMTVRLVVKEMARQEGVHASFMPKPLAGVQGSGMHTHLSLWQGEQNAFVDADDPYGLSPVAQPVHRRAAPPRPGDHRGHQPVGQLLQAAGARLRGARSTSAGPATTARALVRVPVVKHGKTESTRLEYRAPDSACNPYLAFAVILAAGLRGIEEGYELPPEADANLFEPLRASELAAKGIEPLPSSLNDAVDEMERSELLVETLGDHVFEWFIRNKRAEWTAYTVRGDPVRARPLPPACSDRGRRASDAPGGPMPGLTRATDAMSPCCASPTRCRPSWGRPLRRGRLRPRCVSGAAERPTPPSRRRPRTAGPARSCARPTTWPSAIALCRHLRRREEPLTPLLLVVAPPPDRRPASCATTCSTTSASLPLARRRAGGPARAPVLADRAAGSTPDVIEYGPLVLNLETYQAAVAGRVLDLTYMEYELLRFLATHPGKVFTRETLLNRVWGYEYYGGARTVDVHVRRLRAKLGEEHAHLIQTVRSVGYRFGQVGWVPGIAPRTSES